jgi:hypothetical protein
MDIQEYIESGILESYILGSASEKETRELLYFKDKYPQVRSALHELETDMEYIAGQMAVTPPPGVWDKIEASINELATIPEYDPLKFKSPKEDNNYNDLKREQFIEVESESNHMRVHKNWKWVFAAVFVLGKIFLICAIYFYLENRQAQQQIQDLKTRIQQSHIH